MWGASGSRAMLMVIDAEQRVPKRASVAAASSSWLKRAERAFIVVRSDVQRGGTAVDPAGAVVESSLLMALYTVRSERLFCEQLDYNLLFRWFLDLKMDEPGFDHSTFTRNRGASD